MRLQVLPIVFLAVSFTSVWAETFYVRPGESIQAAINAAYVTGGHHEVRVAPGRYDEPLRIFLEWGSLSLSGGWLPPDFTVRAGPEATVLAGTEGAALGVDLRGAARAVVSGFTFTGERDSSPAVWVYMPVDEAPSVTLQGNIFRDNVSTLTRARFSHAAGLVAEAGAGDFSLSDNLFQGNVGRGEPAAGAAYVTAIVGHVTISANRFVRNRCLEAKFGGASALLLQVHGPSPSEVEVADNVFVSNEAETPNLDAALILVSDASRIVARRNELRGNRGDYQVYAGCAGGPLILSDSLVADGAGGGILARQNGCRVHLTNLTVTSNTGEGLRAESWAGTPIDLTNSTLFGNGTDLAGDRVDSRHSLVGTDPHFIDPARGDYHLAWASGSPAIDAGTARTPEGGLGPLDLDRQMRVQNGLVDIGAYEAAPDAPGCRVLDWRSGQQGWPIPAFTNACRCGADAGLREFHCGFMIRDLFLTVRGPLAWQPGRDLPLTWTIDPWTDVDGPYRLSIDALVGGAWVPQTWLGPTAPGLKQGVLVSEPVNVVLPGKQPAEVRTTLKYQRLGAAKASAVTLELLLPAAGPKP